MSGLAGRLAEQGVLRDGLTAAQAADVLWLLTGFDSFEAEGRRVPPGLPSVGMSTPRNYRSVR